MGRLNLKVKVKVKVSWKLRLNLNVESAMVLTPRSCKECFHVNGGYLCLCVLRLKFQWLYDIHGICVYVGGYRLEHICSVVWVVWVLWVSV